MAYLNREQLIAVLSTIIYVKGYSNGTFNAVERAKEIVKESEQANEDLERQERDSYNNSRTATPPAGSGV